ncbi:SAM-dependent methyltransferase [Streptomyces sp. NA04227]|uniref:SAM-dependent methyltransferase n=1 Tax=Streptomyces sp. NA04227 TaxID=2742136 RepID=UPI001591E878|nr:SAM-dependent methyltransferase [Streptomyces sp. NA04227]QKW09569.1 SAM-dependent methyltransferase [Streptomyces sp. NA04227]
MAHDVPVTTSGVPHSARIWNYWLGGKDCYEIDQQVGEEIRRVNPEIVHVARAQRAFLARTVTHLTASAGIRQFLDVGTGLPTVANTHEVAQRIAPDSRIVYVDHDPIVLAHATALLTSTPEGATDYIDADLRDPESILQQAARTLDFGQPVALMLLGIAAHITDDGAYGIVRRLTDALPAGSHLVFCDSTEEFRPESMRAMVEQWNQASDNPRVNRTPAQITRFFDGFEVLEPGLVSVSRWRPEPDDAAGGSQPPVVSSFGGVGRKP